MRKTHGSDESVLATTKADTRYEPAERSRTNTSRSSMAAGHSAIWVSRKEEGEIKSKVREREENNKVGERRKKQR